MTFRRLALAALFSLLAARALAASPTLPSPWLPAEPGLAGVGVSSAAHPHGGGDIYGVILLNRALHFEVDVFDGGLRPEALGDHWSRNRGDLRGELFTLTLRDKQRIAASEFRIEGEIQRSHVEGRPDAARAAERRQAIIELGTEARVTRHLP